MSDRNIEQEVFALIERYNGPVLFSKRHKTLTLESDLYNDLKLAPEDAVDLLEEYAEAFGIKLGDISFTKYFPNTSGLFSFLTPKALRSTGEKPIPLTVGMLVESAKAGRWLYK